MNAVEFTARNVQVACSRSAGAYSVGVEAFGQFVEVDFLAVLEFNAFGSHYSQTAVDDSLVELEIRNAVA